MTNPMTQIKDTFSRIGSLINFGVLLATALGIFVAWGASQANTANAITGLSSRIDQVAAKEDSRWDEHNGYHKERNGEVKTREGVIDTRLANSDKILQDTVASVKQIDYRMTVQEQQTKSISDTLKELTSTLNEVKGDIRVIVARGDEPGTPKRKP